MESGLDRAPCCCFSCGEDGWILEVNETLCRELGYTKAELSGQKVDLIFTLPTRIFCQTHFFPLLKMQGHAAEIFISLRAKNGDHVPVLINAERTMESGHAITSYAGITVHNRKKFEDELVAARKAAETALAENTALLSAQEALHRQMEQLDRQVLLTQKQHEELRQFNRVVTHDLQEPLRKMSVFSHMLMDGVQEKAASPTRPILEKLLRVTETMRSVISGLQQYVWLTEHPKQLTSLTINELLPDVQQQLEADFPEAKLVVETESLPMLTADQGQMHMLLYQLLSNAIRFRKEDADAKVQITGVMVQQNQFRSVAGKYSYGDFLKLRVTDNGIGFDPEYRHQVFDLFRKLHPVSGQGIGLSLCKKIVENHSGTITADSHPGGGATITILLPMMHQEGEREPTNGAAASH